MTWETQQIGESKLILHVGAAKAGLEDVTAVATPEATDTWVPVAHRDVIDEVSSCLGRTGMAVTESAFALYGNGARFFGLLGLDCKGGDGGNAYQLVVGIRNSHDRTFPVGLVVGSRVFVCDNLAFSSEITVTRRHTKNVMDDFPRLITTAVGRIADAADVQERRFAHYRDVKMTDEQAHDMLIQSMDIKAVGSVALPKILQEWREPSQEAFREDFSAWRLWNAYTEVFKGYGGERLPARSIALQGLFDVYTRFVRTPRENAASDIIPAVEEAAIVA